MKTLFKTSIILFFTSIFFLLASCATTVNVRLTRPAKLDLNGAKTIAVLPIAPSSYYKEYDVSTGVGTRFVRNMFYQIFEVQDPNEQQAIDKLQYLIEHGLIESPYIELVSSDAVKRALNTGALNPADVYLTGEVTYFDVTDRRSEERKLVKEARGKEKAEYAMVTYWQREVVFNVKYQIVDSTTEKVISYDEYRCNGTSSKYGAKHSLPSAYSLIESDIQDAARSILHSLQPYSVIKSIKLLECKTKDKALKERMKKADELAESSKIEKASQEFQKIYKETGLIEAGYNAAILQEALGNLSEAENMMNDLYERTSDSRVEKGLSDIRYEISQANRLQKQIKTQDTSEDLDF